MNKKNGHALYSPPREAARPQAEPVCCHIKLDCDGCLFPGHGFICWSTDGSCMKQRYRKEAKHHEPENSA